jgi:hypothetical protein
MELRLQREAADIARSNSSMNNDGPFERSRDRHLFGPGPKQLLALDGGGVRGAISIAFLERLEAILSLHRGVAVRLGDHFDLVGGTSTGAVIAGALALGYRTADIKDFYLRLAPRAFKRQSWRVPILQAKFDARALRNEIDKIVGDRDLDSPDLITGLCVVTKRLDTGSPWILANNPRAPYWNDGDGFDGNKRYKLATLVRASTAAPHYFDPEILPIVSTAGPASESINPPRARGKLAQYVRRRSAAAMPSPQTHGLFIDGGVTPHNNPSLALLQLVTLKPFGICWRTGTEHLSITSIGTGTYRPRLAFETLGFTGFAQLAYHALMSMMADGETLVLMQMQWLGESPVPWKINSEIGTLAEDVPSGGKMFRFQRYDLRLEQAWLAEELDTKVSERDLLRFRRMDDTAIIDDVYALASRAAEKQVKPEHWILAAASGPKNQLMAPREQSA